MELQLLVAALVVAVLLELQTPAVVAVELTGAVVVQVVALAVLV
jgi:hypothetical protein